MSNIKRKALNGNVFETKEYENALEPVSTGKMIRWKNGKQINIPIQVRKLVPKINLNRDQDIPSQKLNLTGDRNNHLNV